MNLLHKNLKRATALTVAISIAGGISFAFHQKHSKIKTSDTVINNVGKIANPQEPTSNTDLWTGNYIYFGHYPQSSDGNGGYNNDPIKWKVLDNNNIAWKNNKSLSENEFCLKGNYGVERNYYSEQGPFRQNAPIDGNGVFLVADKMLDAKQFHNTSNATDGEIIKYASDGSTNGLSGSNGGSTLWAWLNGYDNSNVLNNATIPANSFITTAFTSLEQNFIAKSHIFTYGTTNQNQTSSESEDKIFILSCSEYGKKYGFYQTDSYDRANSLFFTKSDYISAAGDICHLRNRGASDRICSLDMVLSSQMARLNYNNVCHAFLNEYLICPAMNLKSNSVLFVSKSDDSNKPSEISSVPTAFAMPTGYGNEYKLTVKNNDIGFEIDRNSFVQNGSDFTFKYNNATVGSKNYISCIIDKKEDASYVKYYGKLAKAKSSDTITIRIPADIVDGTYQMKFFDEECNGTQETDYASEPVILRVNNEGKVEGTYETTYADIESIEIQPQSHSKSGDGPADQTTVILRGKNFSSDYKVTIEFRIDGEENPVLSYPKNGKPFSDTNNTMFTINIPKSEMEKLNDHIGRYTVETKVETN